MKPSLSSLLLAASGLLLSSPAMAAVVSVDIAGTAYTGAGVLDTTSHTWLLKANNGDTFAIDTQTVTIGYANFSATGSIDAPIDLFDQYKHNGGSTTPLISLTGLDTSQSYDLVIYSAQNAFGGRGGNFSVVTGTYAGTNPQETTGDQQSTFALGVNYVRFNAVTPKAGGVIAIQVANGAETIAVVNGFEIQSVPEPSSLLLLGLGALPLLRRKRG